MVFELSGNKTFEFKIFDNFKLQSKSKRLFLIITVLKSRTHDGCPFIRHYLCVVKIRVARLAIKMQTASESASSEYGPTHTFFRLDAPFFCSTWYSQTPDHEMFLNVLVFLKNNNSMAYQSKERGLWRD